MAFVVEFGNFMVHRHARRLWRQTEAVLGVAKTKNKLTKQQQRLCCYEEGYNTVEARDITQEKKRKEKSSGRRI